MCIRDSAYAVCRQMKSAKRAGVLKTLVPGQFKYVNSGKQKVDNILNGIKSVSYTHLKDAGFRVEAYIIAAPKEFTQLGLYNRYQEEVLSKGPVSYTHLSYIR